MNKKLLGLFGAAALLFALYAGTSWYIGARVQAEAEQVLETTNTYLEKNWYEQVRVTLS